MVNQFDVLYLPQVLVLILHSLYGVLRDFILQKDIDKDGLPLDTDVVINLSGQSIGQPGPWINSIKKSITSSRFVIYYLVGNVIKAVAKLNNSRNTKYFQRTVTIFKSL